MRCKQTILGIHPNLGSPNKNVKRQCDDSSDSPASRHRVSPPLAAIMALSASLTFCLAGSVTPASAALQEEHLEEPIGLLVFRAPLHEMGPVPVKPPPPSGEECGAVALMNARGTAPAIPKIGEETTNKVENRGKDPVKILGESVTSNLEITSKGCKEVELKSFGEKCEVNVKRIAAGLAKWKIKIEYPTEKLEEEKEFPVEE